MTCVWPLHRADLSLPRYLQHGSSSRTAAQKHKVLIIELDREGLAQHNGDLEGAGRKAGGSPARVRTTTQDLLQSRRSTGNQQGQQSAASGSGSKQDALPYKLPRAGTSLQVRHWSVLPCQRQGDDLSGDIAISLLERCEAPTHIYPAITSSMSKVGLDSGWAYCS